MAQGRRVERVAALIRREVSELLVSGIKDERVSLGMVSVTNVEVAGDLQHCKIFVSVYGSADTQQQALAGLRSAASYVKGELSRRLNMRRTPEVVFQLDRGIEKGTSVLGLLNQLEQQRQEIMRKRRHGMGFLGLGSALALLGLRYGSAEAVAFTEQVTRELAVTGWRTGLELAREKGPAPIMNDEELNTLIDLENAVKVLVGIFKETWPKEKL